MSLNEIITKYNITDETAKKEIIKRYEEVQKLANVQQSTDVLWDTTIAKHYQQMLRFKNVLENCDLKENVSSNIYKTLDKFSDMCKNPEFHIAFVGAIKAGKSTLINSVLGQDLASTSVTPETASLTKVKASKTTNYVKLTFYTSNEWKELWNSVTSSKAEVFIEEYKKLNADNEKSDWINKPVLTNEFTDFNELKKEIQKWTSSKSAAHYFVKEVEVGLANSTIPEGVIFVDTPGLDDPVRYRSNITRDYINRANAVLVCVRCDALTGAELATIYSVFANSKYNPEKIYIVGTQLDTLNKPTDEWKQQRAEWCKHLSKNDCYGTTSLAENNLIGVAGHLFNLINNYDNLDEDTMFEIESIALKLRVRECEKNLQFLRDFSNVELLKSKLGNEILNKHRTILINDIVSVYGNLKADLISLLKAIKEGQEDILKVADADIDEIKKQCAESALVLQNVQNDKNEMEKTLKQIKLLTEDRAEDLFKQIKGLGGNLK